MWHISLLDKAFPRSHSSSDTVQALQFYINNESRITGCTLPCVGLSSKLLKTTERLSLCIWLITVNIQLQTFNSGDGKPFFWWNLLIDVWLMLCYVIKVTQWVFVFRPIRKLTQSLTLQSKKKETSWLPLCYSCYTFAQEFTLSSSSRHWKWLVMNYLP